MFENLRISLSFPIIGINLFYLHCITKLLIHCVKSVQIRSFFGPYFPVFGSEKTPYLDTFHAFILDINLQITEINAI